MHTVDKIIRKAKDNRRTIVLPESHDKRVIDAAILAANNEIADIILLGDQGEIEKQTGGFHSPLLRIIDPAKSDDLNKYADILYTLRKAKGLTREQAYEAVKQPLFFGAMMVRNDDADGMVAGAATSSADVLKAAFQIVQLRPGVPIASSCQIMDLSESPFLNAEAWAMADCVINIDPTPEQLAVIAVTTAQTYRMLLDIQPKVAMLSFSTKGSAKHPLVDKVTKATELAREMAPDLLIDGELQFDAAIISGIAELKCPDSRVAGSANVLIFPDIQSGNIGYKIVERVGGAKFVGCVIQGLKRPVSDLSRGCNKNDIVSTIAITAAQVQK